MANPTCRNCDRSADAGAYCRSCIAGIMASALNPHFRSRREKPPPEQRTLRRRPGPTVGNTSGQQRLSDSPGLGVTFCNDSRKIAACWTCGRTFWVWRLRERNFCSGKRRVRHHRSGFRKPAPSTSDRTPAGTG